MSISSINSSTWSTYLTSLTSKTTESKSTTDLSTLTQLMTSIQQQQSGVSYSNGDGDTVQLSTEAVNMSNSISSTKNEMSELINKIVDGTATEEDVDSFTTLITEEFNKMKSRSADSLPPPPPGVSESDMSEMQDLFSKVADGTASEEEVTELATTLKEQFENRESAMQGTPPPPPPAGSGNSDMMEIMDLMKKISEDSASDDDVKQLALKLQEQFNTTQSMQSSTSVY